MGRRLRHLCEPTPREKKVLNYFHAFIHKNGQPPNYNDIAHEFGISVGNAGDIVRYLHEKNELVKINRRFRCYAPHGYNFELSKNEQLVLDLLKTKTEYSYSEIGEKLGLSQASAYALVKSLENKGKLYRTSRHRGIVLL